MLLANARLNWKIGAVVALVAMLTLAVACSSQPEVDSGPDVTKAKPTEVSQPAATPEPVATPEPAEPLAYGIFQAPSTRNYFNFYGGPGGDVWTGYTLDGVATTLYDYAHQSLQWVPVLADGFPSPLMKETVDGNLYWTSEVNLKENAYWSDGVQVTADDFVFVVDTALEMELGNNFYSVVDPDFLSHVEAVTPYKIKVYFYAEDPDGQPMRPGMSIWQFGLAFTPILAKHYWEPVVAQAMLVGDIAEQQEALFSHIPENEPTANGFAYEDSEPGAFIKNVGVDKFWRRGTMVSQYIDGAYREEGPYDVIYYGTGTGKISLTYEIGPHVPSELYIVYGSLDAAILGLIGGEVDYFFNPQGLEKGAREMISKASDLEIVTNLSNKVRYLGFNTRKEPFDNLAFRQAVAILIDKEFVTEKILQGSAFPAYSMVPEGNVAWHNPDVARYGEGLNRGERLAQAVALLKGAGFTYEVEPQISEDGNFVEVPGEGLRMPNGELVPELQILAPSAGYDPMRATFGIWIERWMNDAGIPTKTKLTGFGHIVDTLFSETVATDLDMWIMGWSLSIFPDYMEQYFHSRNIEDNLNWGGYSNAKYDQLANKFLEEDTIEGSRYLVMEMQEYVAEELPYVVLFNPQIVDAYRPSKLKFPYTNALGGIEFVNGMHRTVQID